MSQNLKEFLIAGIKGSFWCVFPIIYIQNQTKLGEIEGEFNTLKEAKNYVSEKGGIYRIESHSN